MIQNTTTRFFGTKKNFVRNGLRTVCSRVKACERLAAAGSKLTCLKAKLFALDECC
jgi:hypothetical protein